MKPRLALVAFVLGLLCVSRGVCADTPTVPVLRADPFRSRVYAVVQNGLNEGSVRVYDPLQEKTVTTIAVGKRPTDLAISRDGKELLVICSVSKTIVAIDLGTLKVKSSIPLPQFDNWDEARTFARVAYGPGQIVYYTDGSWNPVLRVLDRSTGTINQNVQVGYYGVGGFVVSPDLSTLYCWTQNGWHAGSGSSALAKFRVDGEGGLNLQQQTDAQDPESATSDPLNAPPLVSVDGQLLVTRAKVMATADFPRQTRLLPAAAYAMSANGEVAATETAIYAVATGAKLHDLVQKSTVQAITADYARLVYVNPQSQTLGVVKLNSVLKWSSLGLTRTPADKALVQTPLTLRWAPVEGVVRYRVYLGSSSAAATAATTASAEYLGETALLWKTVTKSLTAGSSYYWRVDQVKADGSTVKGAVTSVRISSLKTNLAALTARSVQGDPACALAVTLSSAKAGLAWTAKASATWITLSSASGTTPASLKLTLDTRKLAVGTHTAKIDLTTAEGTISVPVGLTVDALNVTLMQSDPKSAKVYAISEAAESDAAAYLLELDALKQTVSRVVPVGSSVTDLAIHRGDSRIYVTNWKTGLVRALNLSTLAQTRTYAFAVPDENSYAKLDAYRIAAGRKGRLIVESKNDWVSVRLFDTSTGTVLSTASMGAGGGRCDSTGRYYYHGDNNSTASSLHRYDLQTDTFVALKSVRVSSANYTGSRYDLVAENDQRVFWNGAVFSADLSVEWQIGAEIFSASADGGYAFGKTKIYDVARQQTVASMPVETALSAFNTSTGRLVVQKGAGFSFSSPVGPGLLGAAAAPANQASVLAPTQLKWTALPGVARYRVYFGSSASAVGKADTSAVEYLGEVTTSYIALNRTLTAGTTYYWRVDPITTDGVVIAGAVVSFRVTPIAVSVTSIEGATVRGDPRYSASIGLMSSAPGVAWTAKASASWVKLSATSGTTPATLAVTLDATALDVALNLASITLTSGATSITVPVKLQVDPLAVTALDSDPGSTRVFALSEVAVESGTSRAYLLKLDALTQRIVAVARAGASATSLAVHAADNRVYVTNWASGLLLAFDRDTLALARRYSSFVPPDGSSTSSLSVSAVHAAAVGRLIVEDGYLTTAIFDTVNDRVLTTRSAYRSQGNCDPSGRYYYSTDWGTISRFDLSADTFAAAGSIFSSTTYDSSPVVFTEDGQWGFAGQLAFSADLNTTFVLGEMIRSATADGRYAFGGKNIYEVAQERTIAAMPIESTVSAFNRATGRLVVGTTAGFAFYVPVGPGLLGPEVSPAPGRVVLVPSQLTWSAIPGVRGYRVYLGTSAAEVGAATTGSALYLGETATSAISLTSALSTGMTYYWRLDMIADDGTVVTGEVVSFVTSDIVPTGQMIAGTTVQGDPACIASVDLHSTAAGVAWTAQASQAWVKIVNASGVTPSTLQLRLDATTLPEGLNSALVTVSTATGSFSLPVNLQVDPLTVTMLRSEPGSARVFALSEQTLTYGTSRAYLMELDALTGSVHRVVPAGTTATGLAVHGGDHRIYVANRKPGALLAFDDATLALEQTITIPAEDMTNQNGILLAAGRTGRLLIEGEKTLLWNTVTGATIATLSSNVGVGVCDPTGRYYYRKDSNFYVVTRYDLDQDQFTPLGTAYATTYSSERNAVISEDGSRIIINRVAFDPNLAVQWIFPAEIYATDATGRHAFGSRIIYAGDRGDAEATLPVATTISAFNTLTGRLVYQNGAAFGFAAPIAGAGWPVGALPGNDHTVNPPARLTWPSLPGATSYRVYLGTTQAAVAAASTMSAEYLGEATTPAVDVSGKTFASDATYYWRIDAVRSDGVATGEVLAFHVAEVAPDVASIEGRTVQGDPGFAASVSLGSATNGVAWTATASKPWVKLVETAGVTPATLHVKLDASALAVDLAQATITVTSAGGSTSIPVNLDVDPLRIIFLRSDRETTHVYGISQPSVESGLATAYLLDIDTLTKSIVRVVPAGGSVTSLAVHDGDRQVYVANWALGRILAFDRESLDLTRTYRVEAGQVQGFGLNTLDAYELEAGKTGRLVIERYTGDVRLIDTTSEKVLAQTASDSGSGVCDPEGMNYFFGSWGDTTNSLRKLSLVGDAMNEAGFASTSTYSYGGGILMSEDGRRLIWNRTLFTVDLERVGLLPADVYSVTGDGRYAFGATRIYDTSTGRIVAPMPVSTTVSAWNSATGRLVCQVGSRLSITVPVGPGLLGAAAVPANGAIVNNVTRLTWAELPGVAHYRVYLGTSASDVAQATPSSIFYLGEVGSAWITLPESLAAGLTYYWRVDAITGDDQVIPGDVARFTISDIMPDTTTITATTVQGDPGYATSLKLTSTTPGLSWTAAASASWVRLAVTSGVTPATLALSLDASKLSAGIRSASVTITTPTGSFTIPLLLQVDALNVTTMRSDPASTRVYALSEKQVEEETSRAYLLELDAQEKKVLRVTSAGTGATDVVVHHRDGRVYVANGTISKLLGFDLATLTLARTYSFTGPLYGSPGISRIAAGPKGRLVVESRDSYSYVSLYDTEQATILSSFYRYYSSGETDATGRYYYLVSSNWPTELAKYDLSADTFRVVGSFVLKDSSFYSAPRITVSDNGARVGVGNWAVNGQLTQGWNTQSSLRALSGDGRVAICSYGAYDLTRQRAIPGLAVPASTVLALNGHAGMLVRQNGAGFEFTAVASPALTLGVIANQTIDEDRATPALPFTVAEPGFDLAGVTLTVASSNATLVPASGLVLGGSGANRSLTVKPAANQNGTAKITITAKDGAEVATRSFSVTVRAIDDTPTITALKSRTIAVNGTTGAIALKVGDVETPLASLKLTATSSNPSLIPTTNIVFGGSGANRTVTIKPAAGKSGASGLTLTVNDGKLTASTYFVLTVAASNHAPTISAIGNQTVNEDVPTAALPFTIADAEAAVSLLQLTATSSNAALIPATGIALGGTGANRTIRLAPLPNQSGVSTITLKLSDGELTTTRSFTVTVKPVNDAPTISAIGNQTVNEDTPTAVMPFTIGDVETPAASLRITATSSNLTLVPAAGIALGGSGANRSVRITPAANRSGSATITLKVSDGVLTASRAFVVTVTAVNDAPTISAVANQTLAENAATAAIAFTIGDVETAPASLTLSKASSNTTLVPASAIVLGGAGANRTVKVTPAKNKSGVAYVTLTVGDGALTASRTFAVTVNPLPKISAVGPARRVVSVGAPFSATVQATGTGSLTYQWFRNGRKVAGATAASFSQASAAATDAGYYWVDVTDGIGTRRSAPCFVLVAPAATELFGWGDSTSAVTTIPLDLTDAVAVAAGSAHVLAIRADGSVAAWGDNAEGETTVPDGTTGIVAVAAGSAHSLALKSDGTVLAWGAAGAGQSTVPPGLADVVAIAAGGTQSLALKTDGTVVQWGDNGSGQIVAAGALTDVVAIAAGDAHALALKSDGTVAAWGSSSGGQTIVPAGVTGVTAVAAGGAHSLALKSDGTVVAWGADESGQATVPADLAGVRLIGAGGAHSLAVKTDGTVIGWGGNTSGQSTTPAGLAGVCAIAGGGDFSLALCDAAALAPAYLSAGDGITVVAPGDLGIVVVPAPVLPGDVVEALPTSTGSSEAGVPRP